MASEMSVLDSGMVDEITALLGKCAEGLDVFGRLHELAEDMRVLSLNAELAAGRAGDKGASVRVLTQYTRELVFRLDAVDTKIKDLRSQLAIDDNADSADNETWQDTPERVLARIGAIMDCATGLADATKDVGGVGSHASSIATNIAIEAALSGQYEAEFNQVAISMQDYVEQLAGMTDSVTRITRAIKPQAQALCERAERKAAGAATTAAPTTAPTAAPVAATVAAPVAASETAAPVETLSKEQTETVSEEQATNPLIVTESASLFTRLGGEPAIDVVIDVMFATAVEDSRLDVPLEGADMDQVKQAFKSFLSAESGKPVTDTSPDANPATRSDLATILAAWREAGLEDRHLDILDQHLEVALENFQVDPDIIAGVMEIMDQTREQADHRSLMDP